MMPAGIMRLLILCPDLIGPLMAAPGARYHEIARVLSAHARITLASPWPNELELPGVRRALLTQESAAGLLAEADVVLLQGHLMARFPALAQVRVPLIVDLYDPMILESLHLFADRSLARRQYSHESLLALTLQQLHLGDYFLVANRAQHDFYMGMLAAVNRLGPGWAAGGPDTRRLLGLVPCGVAPEPPRPGPVTNGVRAGPPADGSVILWGGGLWDWMDPLTAIRAMARVHAAHPGARLVMWGTRRPTADSEPHAVAGAARGLAAELGLLDRVVFFEDWVPYAERGAWLAEAQLGLSLARASVEARYAHRARLLDCIWAGLPVVTSPGDPLAARLRRDGAAVTVPAGRPARLAQVLIDLLGDPARRAAMRARLEVVRERHSWERATAPLVRWLKDPRVDPCRGRLDFLGPLASLLAQDSRVMGPLVKAGVNLMRHGTWDTLVKASRVGAGRLGLSRGAAR